MEQKMRAIPWLESLERKDPEAEERLNQLAVRTASKVGNEFFAEVVITLSELLGVTHMAITECLEQPPKRVRTLGFCVRKCLQSNIEYDLLGTPCGSVFEKGTYFCSEDVQKSFPTDKDLVEMNLQAYGGISLLNSQGMLVGHLCYLNDEKIEDSAWQLPLMKLLRTRCGAEVDRVRLERIQKEQHEMVEESKRLASLGTLAAGIAHEINNPLTTIRLLVDYGLQSSQADSVMPKQNLELIMNSVRSISQIVEGVLRIASDQDTKKVICNLTGILRRACDLTFHLSDAAKVKVLLEVSESSFVLGNPLELQQVFVNLISNAIQAMVTAEKNEDVKISIVEQNQKLCVSISNQGQRITKEEQSRIFNPFYTSRRSQGGTGLGLSVSLGIIKSHGGDISVQSSKELTEFFVRIPSCEGDEDENCDS